MTDSSVTSGTYTIEQGLPAPWQHQDIGAVAATGTAAYASGTFTIEGSGEDIWETADEFHFVYQGMSGDGTIVARVASVENTNAWAEAGVMIRETLNADSKHASALVAPSGIGFLWRTSTGGTSAYDGVTGSAPYWVKLVRTGSSFTSFRSSDGVTWTQLGTAVTISMTSDVYVGLAVTSHADGILCTGVFDNVVVDQADCGAGIAPGDMATVCRLDPNATAGAFEGVTGPPPDLNGYTALYEARAGNPNNNVDVAWYVSQSCQQTITTSDSESTIESKINGGSQFICVQPGDYTGKGVINISVSGSSGARKVLRYTRDGDNNDEPWNQSSNQQAKFRALGVDGSHWIIHRLSFPPSGAVLSDEYRIRLGQYSSLSNVIVNRCLLEGRGQGYEGLYSTIGGYWSTYNSVTLQNGVVRENWGASAPWAGCGVALQLGTNHRIVNNEIYNLSERLIQIGHDGGPDMSGFVVENNDLYATSSFDGGTQGLNSVKAHATSGNPIIWLHNRIHHSRNGTWGAEGGGEGRMISLADDQITDCSGWGADWVLVKDNIMTDGITGVHGWRYCKYNVSVIGNVFYDMKWDGGSTGQTEPAPCPSEC